MKNFARITGTGSYLPSKIITNFDLEKTSILQTNGLLQELELKKEELLLMKVPVILL
jgi:3-oxoacyl-[acyl-carrier-protein] synthase III